MDLVGYYFTKDEAERKLYRRKFWKLFLFTLFLIYPTVSATVVRSARKAERSENTLRD